MGKKRMRAFEKFMQKKFPNSDIHITPDPKMEFRIYTHGDETAEQIKSAAEEFLGYSEWGEPHYGSE